MFSLDTTLLAQMETPWAIILPVIVIGLSLVWLLPRGGKGLSRLSQILALALIWGSLFSLTGLGHIAVTDVLFGVFSTGAILGGICMITSRNSAYSALWFAIVTLSVCGLFLLRSAPFLSAATVIVYAGAIIVTFLFVLMLAQQEGTAGYDATSSSPLLTTVFGMVLFGSLILGISSWPKISISAASPATSAAGTEVAKAPAAQGHRYFTSAETEQANAWSRHPEGEVGSLHGLGRSLFGDYLFAVEFAGTLLLVACIGAIAMAPRRSQGTL
ncbi:MAG: NADH-quinone oxidoreductase subunit J [Planctomycetota bacterium]|nr:NADH-quinone oxidoreductase subunit J [Planctomycetota bacterium]MDA1210886.1 NADH-quinone oxidoreductase subunit J [Planctomycetota bacterium]